MDRRKKTLIRGRAARAFTLIEMMVVLSVMALLLALSGDLFSGVAKSQQLTTAARLLTAELDQAALLAQKENRPVEVRFLRFHPADLPSSKGKGEKDPPQFRGYQFAVLTGFDASNRPEYRVLTEVNQFPLGVALLPVAEYTSLINLPTREPGPNDPVIGPPYTIASFQIRPDGTTSLPRNAPAVLTLVEEKNLIKNELPLNYRSITIDPDNAHTRLY